MSTITPTVKPTPAPIPAEWHNILPIVAAIIAACQYSSAVQQNFKDPCQDAVTICQILADMGV
jgi:hypothetical protein